MAVSQNELDAAKRVRAYGKYSLLTSVVGIIAFMLFYVYLLSFLSAAASFSLSDPMLWLILLLGLVVLVLGIMAIFSIYKAFAAMAKDDIKKFGRPLMMVKVSVVMLVIGVLLFVLIWLGLPLIAALIGILLLIIGGIVLAWGITLGLWRFGSEFENAVLKIGAITAAFSTFPGLILVYLGAGEIEDELGISK